MYHRRAAPGVPRARRALDRLGRPVDGWGRPSPADAARAPGADFPFSPGPEASRPTTNVDHSAVRVVSASGAYPVRVGAGSLDRLVDHALDAAPARRCALVSDATVDGLWGSSVAERLRGGGFDVVRLTFPAGEAHKTRATWATLTDALLEAGLGRDCCVVSLGGGVVGDVAGFVAATYLRGVPFVQLPTTTLAMIDASVGGKTGVDHPAGKNLVGAFHAPAAVLADPVFLSTLSRDLRAQGYAEAVKHGVLVDASHARWLARRAPGLLRGDVDLVRRAVARAVRIKADVVSADEFESGRRAILNFGHTVAHALELASDYGLAHGRAVAVGMVAEARVGEALGFTEPGTAEEIRELVHAFGLPSDDARLRRPDRLVAAMRRDKKNRRGVVRMVRLPAVGGVDDGGDVTFPVASEDLARILGEGP